MVYIEINKMQDRGDENQEKARGEQSEELRTMDNTILLNGPVAELSDQLE